MAKKTKQQGELSQIGLPNNSQAELWVIKALMDNSERLSLDIAKTLTPEHFLNYTCKEAFSQIVEATEQKLPVIDVLIYGKVQKRLQGLTTIPQEEFCEKLPYNAFQHFREWVEVLNEYYQRRTFAQNLNELIAKSCDITEPMEETLRGLGEAVKGANRLSSDKYSKYLEDDTDSVFTSYLEEPNTIPTNIVLGYGKDSYRFALPSGAITIIGAPTNHGKSKVLQSLALDILPNCKVTEGKQEELLYLTYEESKPNVIKQLLNAYVDLDITEESRQHGNLTTITEYLYNGNTQFIRNKNGERDIFLRKLQEFKGVLHSGALRVIKPEDNYLSTLIGLLRFACENNRVKAIFIDYIQELYIENYKKGQRTDELKAIMIELDLIAQEYNIPIIANAQLNRNGADSPLSLNNQALSDSGWIERKASEVLLLWSNKEKCLNDDSAETKKGAVDREIPTLNISGANDPQKGKMYAVLTKSRLSTTGKSVVLDINGNTGRVHGNSPIELQEGSLFVEVEKPEESLF